MDFSLPEVDLGAAGVIMGTVAFIWATIGKKTRDWFLTLLKVKSEKLSIEEKYDIVTNRRIERLLNTITHYEDIVSDIEKVAEDRLNMIDEYREKNRVLRFQLKEQEEVIRKYNAMIEENKKEIKKLEDVLRKFKIHIKKLESLLNENDLEFDKIDTSYTPLNN